MKKKILYLFSDTGGGHRASALALVSAVNKVNPNVQQEMIDVFAECSALLNFFAKLYGPVVKHTPKLWGRLYYFMDDPKKLNALEKIATPFIQNDFIERLKLIQPDAIVSVHPLVNHLVVKSIRQLKKNIPIITVITDPVTFHPSWICRDVNLLVVATEKAKELAIKYKMPKEKIKMLGLPIDTRFLQRKKKKDARRELKIKEDLRTILLMGGGEGGGNMGKIIRQLDETLPHIQLIVVCGRNQKLEEKLRKSSFSIPIKIFGFTYEIPLLMDAADLIITKAGPGSIAEAMAKELPMIITSWLPGQEEGNAEFVKSAQIGFVETKPVRIANLINWLLTGDELAKIKKNIRKVSQPKASLDIAKCVLSYIK